MKKSINGVYVNLFVGSNTDIKLGDNSIRITQQTRYPWEGRVKITVDPVKTIAIRIEVEPQSILYKAGATGPPAALTIREDTIWREFGIIEWRVK
jgi:hypothetical protein